MSLNGVMVLHVLFVCTGNTCRSPMAEHIFNHLAKEKRLPFIATSAGIAALEGAPAAPNTSKALEKLGITLVHHQARNITEEMIENAHWIITMTEAQRQNLLKRFPRHADKVVLLGALCDDPREVDDPFGGSLPTYERCARQLQDMIAEALPKLTERQ